ncbi:MAG: hypothetical protein WCW25_03205 [Patescibacteria group bacterium]|jgi:hypothetical protein
MDKDNKKLEILNKFDEKNEIVLGMVKTLEEDVRKIKSILKVA